MLELGLEELFRPEHLKAFRERWATDAEIARDDARDIVRILTNPDEREAEIAKLVLLLVGEEPDFDAWMESFAVGSYELRENVRYANRGQRGMQPARFFQDQQRRIDRIVNENLSPAEAAEWRNAYEDAMRLIIASLVLKEMRVGVAAKAALWIAWPLMVAVKDKRFGVRQRKLLALVSEEPAFIDFLRDRLGGVLEDWIDQKLDGHEPSTRTLHEASLFHEPSEEEARAILQPAETYRSQLLNSLGYETMAAEPGRPFSLGPREQATEDAKALASDLQVGGPQDSDGFSEFQGFPDPLDYSEESFENLRRILPILANERKDSHNLQAAAERGLARSKFLRISEDRKITAHVDRIHRWVESGATPPPDLNVLYASLYEDAVCSFLIYGERRLDEAWIEFDFPEATEKVAFTEGSR